MGLIAVTEVSAARSIVVERKEKVVVTTGTAVAQEAPVVPKHPAEVRGGSCWIDRVEGMVSSHERAPPGEENAAV